MKIAIIFGTRPEIIKLSPVIRELQKKKVDFFIIHSNQHYSPKMDEIFLKELKLPEAKYNLNVGSGLHGEMTAKILSGTEKVLMQEKPNIVIVQGDTNTVLAGALAASKLEIEVAHVEAGLRSYDRTMPEETNRILADHMSNFLFAPTKIQSDILLKEGIDPKKTFVVGNTIVDSVTENLKIAETKSEYLHYQTEKFFLLTMHRPSNVDSKDRLLALLNSLTTISKTFGYPIYYPIHPRTKKQLKLFKLNLNPKYIKITEPVGYLEMLIMEKYSQAIFTDSGGLQEEACILQVPCITLRDNTERPETITVGANLLATPQNLLSQTKTMLSKPKNWSNPFGDGHSASIILNNIL
jgi:UDP-N-acetylglucosamine 2-epimerase (non-hydrolysing)